MEGFDSSFYFDVLTGKLKVDWGWFDIKISSALRKVFLVLRNKYSGKSPGKRCKRDIISTAYQISSRRYLPSGVLKFIRINFNEINYCIARYQIGFSGWKPWEGVFSAEEEQSFLEEAVNDMTEAKHKLLELQKLSGKDEANKIKYLFLINLGERLIEEIRHNQSHNL